MTKSVCVRVIWESTILIDESTNLFYHKFDHVKVNKTQIETQIPCEDSIYIAGRVFVHYFERTLPDCQLNSENVPC